MSTSNNNKVNPQYALSSVIMHADRFTIEEQTNSSESDSRLADFDITQQVLELLIYENMDRHFLTGEITVTDNDGLFSDIQFQGTERITIGLSTTDKNSTPMVLNKNFIAYQIKKQVKDEGGKASYFVISLIDEHGFLGQVTKISKSYNGSLERIVKSICQSELGRQVDISYTGAQTPDDEFSSQQDITCIIPNMTPNQALEWLCKRLTTENGTPYYLFATLNLPSILDGNSNSEVQEDINEGNIIKLANLDFMLQQKPFSNNSYIYNPTSTTRNTENPIQDSFVVREVEYGSSANTLKLLKLGAFSSDYANTNLSTGEITSVKYNLGDQLNNMSKQNIIENENGASQNVYDGELILLTKKIEEFNAVKYHSITSTGTYGNLKSYHDETDESKFRMKVSSASIKNLLNKNNITIVIDGSTLMLGNACIGDKLDLAITSDNMSNTDVDSPTGMRDSRHSGEYLIYAVKHHFFGTSHSATCKLVSLESA
jgi:hypothetical protein